MPDIAPAARGIAIALALAGVVVAPLATAYFLSRAATPSSLAQASHDVAKVVVETRELTLTYPSTVEVSISIPPPPPTDGHQGIVTAVAVSTGQVVKEGDALFAVDARTRFAYDPSISGALYRDLCAGASGQDVATLQRLLALLGDYDGTLDGDFGPATTAAVKSFNSRMSASREQCFNADQALALPVSAPTVGDVTFAVGLPVATDTGWFTWAPTVDHVEVTPEGGSPVPGTYALRIEGHEYAAQVAGTSVSIDDPAALVPLAGTDGTAQLTGSLAMVEPIDVQVVPATALAVAANLETCVAVVGEGIAAPTYVVVEPLEAALSDVVAVSPVPELNGASVLVRPQLEAPLPSCR